MKTLQLQEIANALGVKSPGTGAVQAICTDSRHVEPGCLFVALHGENVDGHQYAAQAVSRGAVAVLCERPCGTKTELLVPSTFQALLDLAGYYRSLFPIPVVALTGSVGKTTTKEMTALVLASKYRVLKTQGNFNNEVGLPKTVFGIDDTTEIAVLEMGMSAPGEIESLSLAAKPTLGILTNVGISHIETLGSKENILRAKLELTAGMPADSPIIVNADDPLLYEARIPGYPIYYYGIDNPFCRFKAYDLQTKSGRTAFVIDYGMGEVPVELPSMGRHNVYNALAAFAAGFLLGVDPQQAAAALQSYVPAGMRQRVRVVGGITFIEDCYNASPDSQRAALAVLGEMQANRRIAVLGDMLELGGAAADAHMQAGLMAAGQDVDVLLTLGENSQLTAQAARQAGVCDVESFLEKQPLIDRLQALLQQGDAVLVKGSRGMRLEEVLDAVYAGLGQT